GKFKLPGESELTINVIMNYKIVEASGKLGPYKVRITAYYYSLEDKDGDEILLYHWHPDNTPNIKFPHLHICQTNFKKKHLPTSRIALEQVLRLVVDEF